MNRPLVSYGLFVEDEDESVKICPTVTDCHLGKTQVPGPSKLSEPMVTGVSTNSGPSTQSAIGLTSTTTSLLNTVTSQPPPREDEGRDTSIRDSNGESAFESTNVSESTPKILNDQANIADVEMKDLSSH